MFCDADVSGLVKECLNELELNIQIYSFRGKTNETHAVEDLFEETFEEEKFVLVSYYFLPFRIILLKDFRLYV